MLPAIFFVTDQYYNYVIEYPLGYGSYLYAVNAAYQEGFSGDGGPASNATLYDPQALAFDLAGNLFIGDSSNNVVRRVDAVTGFISTVAGVAPAVNSSYTGTPTIPNAGYDGDGGLATAAHLNDPEGLAIDTVGNLYIADSSNTVVRKVNALDQKISTTAGVFTAPVTSSTTLPLGSANNGGTGGPANATGMGYLQDLAIDSSGNLYIADGYNTKLREMTIAHATATFTPSLAVGASSAASDLTFSNLGNAPLTFASLVNPADFNQQGTDTSCGAGTSLPSGASCVLGLEFLPTASGALSETLTVTNNSFNLAAATQTVAEAGVGLEQPASKLVFVPAGPIGITPGGNLGTVVVDIDNSVGVVVADATNTVSITITGPAGFTPITVPGTVVNGVASFNLGSTALPGGAYVLTATSSPALTPGVLNVTVSAPTQLAFTPLPPVGIIYGGNLGIVTLSVENASNTVVAVSVPLTATITDPNGVVTTINGNLTNASGVATYDTSSQTFTTAGNYTIVVTSPGLTAATANFTVNPAPATKLAISGVAPTVPVNGNLGTVTVSVENASSGVVTSANYPVSITITGPNGFSVNAMGTAVNGIAVINVGGIAFSAAGMYTITAMTGDINSSAPVTFTVVPAAAASKLVLSGVASAVALNGNLGGVTVSVENSLNGVVATATNLITVTITGPNGFSATAQGTAVNGVAVINLAGIPFSVAGGYSITASTANLASAPAVAFTVVSTPTKLTLAGVVPTVAFGGSQGTVTVSVQDAFSNLVSISTASVTLNVTGPNGFTRQITVPAVNGVATFNLSSILYAPAGTYTVTANSTGLTQASATFIVSAAAAAQPAQLAEAGLPVFVTQGGNLGGAVTISIETTAGAVVTSSTVPVTITITGPGGYTQIVTVAAVNGVAPFNLTSFVLSTLGNYFVTASSPGLPTLTFPFTVQQDFTLATGTLAGAAAAPPQTVVPGMPAVYPLVLAPAGVTFTGPITLSASGLPPGATYSFNPAVVTPGPTAATSTLTVTTANTTAAVRHPRWTGGMGGLALAALMLPFAGSRRLRLAARRVSLTGIALALLSFGAVATLSGCAIGGLYGHSPQSYVITVTGTSGAISHSTTVTLIEQ